MNPSLTEDQEAKLSQVRVLIVEDSPVDRLFLKTSLQKIGLQSIHEAHDGTDAVSKTLSARDMGSPYHLILTDWKMPKKDGLAFLREIRSERFKLRPYVIMLTSHADVENVTKAKAAGIDDYIVKPFKLHLITEKILLAIDKFTL